MKFPSSRFRRATFSGHADSDASLNVSGESSMRPRGTHNNTTLPQPSSKLNIPKSPSTQHAKEYTLSKKQRPRSSRNNPRSLNDTTQFLVKDDSESTNNCAASLGNPCVSTVTNWRHASTPTALSSALLPVASREPTTTLVTVIFEVGLYPTGAPHVSAFTTALPTQAQNSTSAPISTATGTPIITSTVAPSTPTRNALLFATTTASESQATVSSSHGSSIDLTEAAPILGGLIGGLLGLFLIGFIVSICARMRRRRKEKEVLDMMAPSDLPPSFIAGPQNHPRLSSTWVGPLEYPNERRNSRFGF